MFNFNSRKLDSLSQNVSSISVENRTNLQTTNARICHSTDRLSAENKTGFAAVSTKFDRLHLAEEARYRGTLVRFNDQAQTESINSGRLLDIAHQQSQIMDTTHNIIDLLNEKFSSNSWKHKMTRLAIDRLQKDLQSSKNIH